MSDQIDQIEVRAGEGNKLPKGLSLFRFVLFSSLMLGAAYGGASLWFNAPPIPGDIPPNGVPSRDWEPSVCWVPSWIAIKTGIGVNRSAGGYVFTGKKGHAFHGITVMALGILCGAAAGWPLGEMIRREAVRRRYD